MLEAALAYATRGRHVFPLYGVTTKGRCTCGVYPCGDENKSAGKHPREKGGFKNATREAATIRAWWTRWPDANIGIRTGRESGVIVLDVDPRNDGDESLEDLRATYGDLPETVACLTGGGGSHHYFAHPGDREVKGATNFGGFRGLDLKADGGYVVAPPSTHASGREYVWNVLLHPEETALAPCPSFILELAGQRTEGAATAATPGEPVREGARNTTLTSFAGTMRRRGMSEGAILAALLEENNGFQPPLSAHEVSTIAKNVGRYAPGDVPRATENPEAAERERAAEERLRELLRGFTAAKAFEEDGRAIPVPPRRWVVPHLLPLGVHGLMVGGGGAGKGLTLLALSDYVARGEAIDAVRWPANGAVPEPVTLRAGDARGVLLVGKEDDEPEILRRILACQALRYGDDWASRVTVEERAQLAKYVHVVCLPAPVEMNGMFLRLLRERAREVPDLAWIALDPLGRFLCRDEDGRMLRFVDGEYAAQVTDFIADLAETTGACVTPGVHMTRASRRAQREGGEAARGVRADPYGSELLLSFARFSLGLEPITSAGDLDALRLGTDRTWMRLGLGKSNYGDSDVTVIAERVRGAVRLVNMSAVGLGSATDATDGPVKRTPGELGFVVSELATKSGIAKKLFGTTSKPSERQQDHGDRLAHQWAARGWVKPGDGGRGWRILALGTPVSEVPNAER